MALVKRLVGEPVLKGIECVSNGFFPCFPKEKMLSISFHAGAGEMERIK
jgi:hypothetical protein